MGPRGLRPLLPMVGIVALELLGQVFLVAVEMIVAGEGDEVADFLRDLREDSAVAHHIKGAFEEEIAPLPDLKGFTIVA